MKILTVVGARPQFIKAAAVSRLIRDQYCDKILEVIVHTGQHHDENMSQVFFDQLDIPKPDVNLAIAGGHHGEMTGRMLQGIEKVLLEQRPDWVLVYGDTNSTLAGALAAAKLHIPVAHVEAGLRSFNMRMPEEVNRVLTDRMSSLLFCPTDTAVQNLLKEGMVNGVHQVGDVMFDAALFYGERALTGSSVLKDLSLHYKRFALATCHRAQNTDDLSNLREILTALNQIATEHMPVVLPLHPRTRKKIQHFKLEQLLECLIITEPLAFLDMMALEKAAAAILTDSGGVQKEALFHAVPCITMRDETEWTETVTLGWNKLVGANSAAIKQAFCQLASGSSPRVENHPYGKGNSGMAIIDKILGSGIESD